MKAAMRTIFVHFIALYGVGMPFKNMAPAATGTSPLNHCLQFAGL
jgi:hypothetical protein